MITQIVVYEIDGSTYTKIHSPLTDAVPQRRDSNYISRSDRNAGINKNIFCSMIYDPIKALIRDSANSLVESKCKELLAGKILNAKKLKCKK